MHNNIVAAVVAITAVAVAASVAVAISGGENAGQIVTAILGATAPTVAALLALGKSSEAASNTHETRNEVVRAREQLQQAHNETPQQVKDVVEELLNETKGENK